LIAKVTNEIREIIRTDSIEPARSQAGEQVPFEGVQVALSGSRPQIAHGSCEPLLGNVGEPEVCAVDHLLASVPARDELIPKSSGRGDPARHRPPSLLVSSVLEPDLEDAGTAAIDVALNPLSTRGVSCFRHDRPTTPR
jgi:hypothetical protein